MRPARGMERLAALLALTVAAGAEAQSPAPSEVARDARAAEVEALEPAVDVGVRRVPSQATGARSRPERGGTGPASGATSSASSNAGALASAGPGSAGSSGATGGRPINAAGAVDRIDLGTTSITGNQELPKVLYIVPWKRSDLGELVGRPVNTLLDEVLSPVDPDVFQRHLEYYDELFDAPRSGEAGADD